MDVTVVGLGKIGLPFAVQAAGRGHRVFGADASPSVVEAVTDGQEPVPGEFDLQRRLEDVVASGHLTATTDTTWATSNSEVVVVVVPLVVNRFGDIDFVALDSVTDDIAAGLCPGTLVSYETTMPVGTTRGRLAARLAEVSTLSLGHDLFVVHSPERVSVGRVFADLRRYPKLVGGVDPESTCRGGEFYRHLLEFDDRPDLDRANGVWEMASSEAAEVAKIAETTYRNVNIALVNEFACFATATGLDVFEVIEAANSQPFSHLHQPGIAVGGHCIPVYPKFYLSNDPEALLPSAAIRVNEGMPQFAVNAVVDRFGDLSGRRVVILGVAFRGGVKEEALSGAFALADALRTRGALVLAHDPLYESAELRELGLDPYELGEPCDMAFIQTDHEDYKSLVPEDLPGLALMYDGRHLLDPSHWPNATFLQLGKSL